MNKLNNKGFTLIEVLAVVVIIGVLGLIAIPSVFTSINKSRQTAYDILVEDIVIASKQLFDELDFTGGVIYKYNANGITGDVLKIEDKTEEANSEEGFTPTSSTPKKIIPSNMFVRVHFNSVKTIEINLQTLVSNGFLTGKNNPDKTGTNKNNKIITNPITKEDMGDCNITIYKAVAPVSSTETNVVAEYYITGGSTDSKCPTTDEYEKIIYKGV